MVAAQKCQFYNRLEQSLQQAMVGILFHSLCDLVEIQESHAWPDILVRAYV